MGEPGDHGVGRKVSEELSDRGVTKGYLKLHQATSGNKAIDVFSSIIYNKEQEDTSRYKAGVFS